jgi:hypothetical protein
VTEVARVYDDFDVFVFRGNRLQDGNGIVSGAVVDKDVFILVLADPNHDLAHLIVEGENILLLVIARRYDRDRLPLPQAGLLRSPFSLAEVLCGGYQRNNL